MRSSSCCCSLASLSASWASSRAFSASSAARSAGCVVAVAVVMVVSFLISGESPLGLGEDGHQFALAFSLLHADLPYPRNYHVRRVGVVVGLDVFILLQEWPDEVPALLVKLHATQHQA